MDYLVILKIKDHNKDKHDYSNMCDAVYNLSTNTNKCDQIRNPICYDTQLFVWYLDSKLTSEKIYNKLVKNIVEDDDELLVIEMNRENTYGYGKSFFWIAINRFWKKRDDNRNIFKKLIKHVTGDN